MLRMSWMAQPDQGFGVQLAGTFTADPELPANLSIEAAVLPI
jgi:hypothetical protein